MKRILIIIGIALIITTGFGLMTSRMFFNEVKEIPENIRQVKIDEEVIVSDEAIEKEVVGIDIGHIAPDFTLNNINDEEESLEGYRGKNILLNFFSTT